MAFHQHIYVEVDSFLYLYDCIRVLQSVANNSYSRKRYVCFNTSTKGVLFRGNFIYDASRKGQLTLRNKEYLCFALVDYCKSSQEIYP